MKKSATIITTVAVALCIAVLIGVSIAAPVLAELFAEYRGIGETVKNAIMISYYICTVPALISLISLWRILYNIRREEPYLPQNASLMALVSLCCNAVALVCTVCGFYYMPMWFISAAMLFVFLIVRVVRGCFIAAMYIKEENSLTI